MYEAVQSRLRRLGHHGDLTPLQQQALKAVLMMRSVVREWGKEGLILQFALPLSAAGKSSRVWKT